MQRLIVKKQMLKKDYPNKDLELLSDLTYEIYCNFLHEKYKPDLLDVEIQNTCNNTIKYDCSVWVVIKEDDDSYSNFNEETDLETKITAQLKALDDFISAEYVKKKAIADELDNLDDDIPF